MSTIEKALTLLDFFSSSRSEIGLTEFKNLSGLDKGTTHRYLNSLKIMGFLEQNRVTRGYRLGPAVMRLANVRERTTPMARIVRSHIDPLAEEIGELVHAALPQTGGMSSLYARDGGILGTRVGFDEAELLPFHATSSGIAMLAFGPDTMKDELHTRQLKSYTSSTTSDLDEVHRLISKAREQGYVATDQTYEDDVCSVALPFFGADDFAVGTIAIATPSARMTDKMRPLFATRLGNAARAITTDLGGQVPATLDQIWTEFQPVLAETPQP